MRNISVAIEARSGETRVLVRGGAGDMMVARLGAVSQIQPGALGLLLEALALWHRSRLRVVLCAECEPQLESTGLTDGFGFGVDTLHYTVRVLDRDLHRKLGRVRLRGLGDFSHLRRDLRETDSL
jgi:hypothetical protein